MIDSVETAVVLMEGTQHVRPHPFSDLPDTRGFAQRLTFIWKLPILSSSSAISVSSHKMERNASTCD